MKTLFFPLFVCTFLFSCTKEYSAENGPNIAFVITTPASVITGTTATSGGNVISGGGSPVTARGVCWSTTPGPTIALLTKTNDGTGTGIFTSSLTGLIPDSTYYLRAYITTAAGTTYGLEKSFKTTVSTGPLTVGSSYGGGIIAYVLQAGDPGYDPNVTHGIIAATEYVTPLDWSLQDFGTFVLTGATDTVIGTGLVNTNKIIAVEGPGIYAAQYCADLVLNGYSDWYLPSKHEMWVLYQNRASIGGLNYTAYWTSTESSLSGAIFLLILSAPDFAFGYKGSPAYLRAVRAF